MTPCVCHSSSSLFLALDLVLCGNALLQSAYFTHTFKDKLVRVVPLPFDNRMPRIILAARNVAQVRDWWRTLVIAVMNLRVP